jgi:hypothetical protein
MGGVGKENDAPNFTIEGFIYYNALVMKKPTFPLE